jgi:hypothetical protein
MLRPQVTWRPESLLADPVLAGLPLELRRAHAFAKLLAEMPIDIAEDELVVGKCAIGGTVCTTALGEFATEAEHARAKEEGSRITSTLSHKSPDYPTLLSRGLRGILDEVAARAATLAAQPASDQRDERRRFL